MNPGEEFLQSVIKRLLYYKELGDKTFACLNEADFHYQYNSACNTIAINIQHMAGNMLSRWTDLLTSDGEKEWRQRDMEFEEQQLSKKQLLELWEKGWACLLAALNSLKEEDLLKTVHIRTEELTVMDAINRQLAHYPYHVGQIIHIGKMILGDNWVSLSIPRGQSSSFNPQMGNKS